VTTLGFGSILIVRGLIITGTGSIWLVVRRRRRRRKERTEALEASSGVNIEMMMMNNRGAKEEDHN
jgi:Flp pilus assembly protein TadB